MIILRAFFLQLFFLCTFQSVCTLPLAEQFKTVGYAEICDKKQGVETFDSLYEYFDDLIEVLQTNPIWQRKLYIAKERFIRSKARNYYSTEKSDTLFRTMISAETG